MVVGNSYSCNHTIRPFRGNMEADSLYSLATLSFILPEKITWIFHLNNAIAISWLACIWVFYPPSNLLYWNSKFFHVTMIFRKYWKMNLFTINENGYFTNALLPIV